MDIKSMIDHTILKPDAKKMRSKLFVKRQEFGFYAVCVNPSTSPCVRICRGSKVKIATVIDSLGQYQ